nr:MAG TPA: hypothetical protein [Caudoviricetes sp.]
MAKSYSEILFAFINSLIASRPLSILLTLNTPFFLF